MPLNSQMTEKPRHRKTSSVVEDMIPQYLRNHMSELNQHFDTFDQRLAVHLETIDQRLEAHLEATKNDHLKGWWATDEGQQDYKARSRSLLAEQVKEKMAEMAENIRKAVAEKYEQKYQEQLVLRLSALKGLFDMQNSASPKPTASIDWVNLFDDAIHK